MTSSQVGHSHPELAQSVAYRQNIAMQGETSNGIMLSSNMLFYAIPPAGEVHLAPDGFNHHGYERHHGRLLRSCLLLASYAVPWILYLLNVGKSARTSGCIAWPREAPSRRHDRKKVQKFSTQARQIAMN